MLITLKISNSENNRMIKNFIGDSKPYEFIFKNESSLFNPSITIATNDDITKYNYGEISEFNRKYFISEITLVRNGLYKIDLNEDVLSTYSAELSNISCIVEKQENRDPSNLYKNDGSFVTLNKEYNTILNFPNGLIEQGEFILITAGG